jgi:hypothetical protein
MPTAVNGESAAKRRKVAAGHSRSASDYSDSDSENDQTLNTNGTKDTNGAKAAKEPEDDMTKVLAGTAGVKALAKNSNGETQAAQLGYPSKLVSKWYHHQCEYDSCPERWAEFDNVDDEKTDLVARTANVPIIHRHHYQNKHWVTQSVTIQDPAMRDVLRVVLAKYQDLDLDLINWTFQPPFMPLVHRWEELKSHYVKLEDGAQKNAAAALLAFITPIVASSVLSLAQTKTTGKVNFENVWQIFPPSSIVKTKFYGVDVVCRVVKYKRKPRTNCNPEGWTIDMEFVDWNGEKSGWTTTSLTIWEYDGYKKVTGLPVFPISFSPEESKIRSEMIERGRKWAGLRGYHFEVANGTKILLETEEPQQRPVSISWDPSAMVQEVLIIYLLVFRSLERCAWMPMLTIEAATSSSPTFAPSPP